MKSCRLLLAIFLVVTCATAGELDSLFVRIKNNYSTETSLEEALPVAMSLRSDGTWTGPEYHKKGHTPIEHLKNIRTLAEGYEHSCRNHSVDCEKIKAAANQALQYWFSRQKDFVSDNWWMNEIGIPRELVAIAFLLEDDIPHTLRSRIISTLPKSPSGNGANRMWISELVVVRGIFEQKSSLVRLGLKNIQTAMLVTGQEGHQKDHSYFMHGNLLYNGGYGKIALSIAANWAAICRGTGFAFDKESIEAMNALALEGSRWMMWKGMVDPMVLGREISRRGGNMDASGFASIISDLALVDLSQGSPHAEEYSNWRREIFGENVLSGCRYFERGELMVCRSNDYYISLKMSSKNTVGSESINRENRKGLWLGAGVLSVYSHSDDFKNIYPLWDWSMLPGTTCDSRFEQKEKRVSNESVRVGGVSDGLNGVAAMELNRSGMYAKKAWLIFGGKVIALGSDISSKEKSEVKTTLDQRYVRSKVSQKGPRVWHDSTGYASLSNSEIFWDTNFVQGDWSSIGTEKKSVSGNILKIWMSHGKMTNDAKYAYAIFLGVSQNDFLEGQNFGVKVVQNDSQAQVAMDQTSGIYGGVVYTATSIKKGNINVSFDRPCVFLVNPSGKIFKKDLP